MRKLVLLIRKLVLLIRKLLICGGGGVLGSGNNFARHVLYRRTLQILVPKNAGVLGE